MKLINLFEQEKRFNVGDDVIVKNYQGVGTIHSIVHFGEVRIFFKETPENIESGTAGMRVIAPVSDLQLVTQAVDQEYQVVEINRHDLVTLEMFSDLVNANTGQLSWKLTPQKLLKKMGILGGIFGLYFGDELVGGVSVKQIDFAENVKAGEIGYMFILPDHRTLKNIRLLYNASLENARRFDVLFVTTNKKNRPVNILLARTPKMKFLFSAKSPYTNNMLNYWLSIFSNKKYSLEEREDMVRAEYDTENTD